MGEHVTQNQTTVEIGGNILDGIGPLAPELPSMQSHDLGDNASPITVEITPKYPTLVTFPVLPVDHRARQLRKLPVEIWSMIFESYVMLDCPVRVLLLVCRDWNQICRETPKIWRRILLSADTTPGSLRAGSVHTCTSSEAVKTTLANAGASLLELTLVVGPNDENAPTPEARSEFFQLVKPVLPRVTFLCKIVNPRMTLDLLKRSLANVYEGQELKHLESLMVASAYPIGSLYDPLTPMLDVIDSSAKDLKSIYLENVNRDFIVSVSERPFWANLVRITIRHEFDAVDVTCFIECTKLEFLSYSGEMAYAETNHGRKFEYANLKWLKVGLITMKALSMIKLPTLHTLVIDSVRNEYPETPPAPHTILIPMLKVFHLLTVMPTAAAIRAPKIETFHLSIQTVKQSDADNVLRAIFDDQEGMLQPKHLSISAPAHDKHLLNVLKLQPNLISLSLDQQAQYSKTFFREITPSTRQQRSFFGVGSVMPTKPILMPKLRSLTMDMQRIQAAANAASTVPNAKKSLIQTLIQHRKEVSACVELLRVAVRWKPNEPSEEFIHPTMCLTCIEAHIQTEAHNTQAPEPIESGQDPPAP